MRLLIPALVLLSNPCFAQPSPSAPLAEHLRFLVTSSQSAFADIRGEAQSATVFASRYRLPDAGQARIDVEGELARYLTLVAAGSPAEVDAAEEHFAAEITAALPRFTRINPAKDAADPTWAECLEPSAGTIVTLERQPNQGLTTLLLNVYHRARPCPAG